MNIVQDHEEKTDIRILQNSTRIIGNNLSVLMHRDRQYLLSLASILSNYDSYADNRVLSILSSYKDSNLLTEICILLPGDTLIRQDGRLMNVRGILSFDDESAQGIHVTKKTLSFMQEYNFVVRNFVPVIKDGKTVAMLYAIINLEALNQSIPTNLLLDTKTDMYVFDPKNGDLIVDTWHKSLRNINMLYYRAPASGQNLEDVFNNIKEKKGGEYVFFSTKTLKRVYFHYEPLGVNDWYIAMSRPEKEVFGDAIYISHVLYKFAAFASFITAIYILFCFYSWKKNVNFIMELGSIDTTTKLYNRNRLSKDTREITTNENCPPLVVYVDVNGLHEVNNTQGHKAGDKMLRHVAKTLSNAFSSDKLYRIGGDEFFIICTSAYEGQLQSMIEKIKNELRIYHYEIAVGTSYKEQFNSVDEMMSASDESMLADKRAFYKGRNDRRKCRNC